MSSAGLPDSMMGRAFGGEPEPLAAGRWVIDPQLSTVSFTIRHLMVATVGGRFEHFTGELETDATGVTKATGSVETASIATGDAKRDEVLLGEGFLDADRHPAITFAAQDVGHASDGEVEINGLLAIKGITRPVRLTGTIAAGPANTAANPVRLRLTLSGAISRTDFGVTGGGILEAHGAVLSDTVKISLEVSARRRDKARS